MGSSGNWRALASIAANQRKDSTCEQDGIPRMPNPALSDEIVASGPPGFAQPSSMWK